MAYIYKDIKDVKPGDVLEAAVNSDTITKGKLYYVLKDGSPAGMTYCRDDGEISEGFNPSPDYWKLIKTSPGNVAAIGDKVFCYTYNNAHSGANWVTGTIYTIERWSSDYNTAKAFGNNWNNPSTFITLHTVQIKFNKSILEYDIPVNCTTNEQAVALTTWAHNNGKKWASGKSYKDCTDWEDYNTATVYLVNKGTHSGISTHNHHNENIWSYQDALKE